MMCQRYFGRFVASLSWLNGKHYRASYKNGIGSLLFQCRKAYHRIEWYHWMNQKSTILQNIPGKYGAVAGESECAIAQMKYCIISCMLAKSLIG